MRRYAHVLCVVTCLVLPAVSPANDNISNDFAEMAKLRGKWEVVSVRRDGDHQHGEVGQQPGDVITVESLIHEQLLFS